jgi:hypothetical protein
MKKASKVHGKKYVLKGPDTYWGSTILYADAIKHFPAYYRDKVKHNEAILFRAHGDKIYLVGLDGRLPKNA